LPKYGSDHRHLVLNTNGANVQNSKIFRFEKEWIYNDDFNRLVAKWWLEIYLTGILGRADIKN
jgi:hypothetical protein